MLQKIRNNPNKWHNVQHRKTTKLCLVDPNFAPFPVAQDPWIAQTQSWCARPEFEAWPRPACAFCRASRHCFSMFFGCTYWGRLNINSHGHRSRCSPEFSLVKNLVNLCEPEAPATLRRCSQTCSVPRYRSRPRGWPSAGDKFIIPRPRETPRPLQSLIFAHLFIDFYELCSLQNVSVRSTLLLIHLININQ